MLIEKTSYREDKNVTSKSYLKGTNLVSNSKFGVWGMFLNNKEALIRHDFRQYEAINLK